MTGAEDNDLQSEDDDYVSRPQMRASRALISQLPSMSIRSLIDKKVEEQKLTESDGTQHRKGSRFITLKLKNAVISESNGIDADKIFKILNRDKDSNYKEKVATLLEMPISLSVKREVLRKLEQEKMITPTENQGICFRLKSCIRRAVSKFWNELKNWCYLLEPWRSSIKTIHGRFGSSVSSYFVFLRWLLYLNLCNFFISLWFVIIPQVAHGSHSNQTQAFNAADFFTGEGWLKDTLLYFGFYASEVIEPISGLPYNMPLAYLCAACANVLIILIVLIISITSWYEKSVLDTAGEIKNVFCNKISSGWDYSIQTEEAAELQSKIVCNDLREMLYAKSLSKRTITHRQNILQKVSFVAVSLFFFGTVVGVGYFTYVLLKTVSLKEVETMKQLRFPVMLTLIFSFSYYLLKYASKLETYITAKSRLYLTMIRTAILRAVSLGVVVYFWMIVYKPPRHHKVCYETELGSELYRLILMNFLSAVFIVTLSVELIHKFTRLSLCSVFSVKEFDVAYNTLDLIYFQTLTWLAMFYVPFVSLIMVAVLVLMFYVKKGSLFLGFSRPPNKSWSINEMQTFYLTLNFFMFLFCVLIVGYTIFGLEASDCGPFKDFSTSGEVLHGVFFEGSVGRVVRGILEFVTSPFVLVVVFFALCLAVHYKRSQAIARISAIKNIRESIKQAGKDKTFLLQFYDEAVNEKEATKKDRKNLKRRRKKN